MDRSSSWVSNSVTNLQRTVGGWRQLKIFVEALYSGGLYSAVVFYTLMMMMMISFLVFFLVALPEITLHQVVDIYYWMRPHAHAWLDKHVTFHLYVLAWQCNAKKGASLVDVT